LRGKDFLVWLILVSVGAHIVFTQVFHYKTYVTQKAHYSTMESLSAKYKDESIRVSEEFNDIMREMNE